VNSAQQRATEFAQHYYSTAFEAAGLTWGADNNTEVEDLIEYTVTAAKVEAIAEIRDELKALQEQVNVLSSALGMHEITHAG